MTREFTSKLISKNMYAVTTMIGDNERTYTCVVANDETELAELLEISIQHDLSPPMPPEKTYADFRRDEYPSIVDQLDILYHAGFETWKTTIQAIKDKYPK